MKLTWMIPAAALTLVGCVATTEVEAPAVAAGGMTAAQIVAARQAAFQMSAITSGAMKNAVTSGADVKTQAFAARGLARWSQALPTTFPAETADIPSRAKAEIWTDRQEFERLAGEFAAAAGGLPQLAQAGDREAFGARLGRTQAACAACHDRFRSDP